jgi:calcium-dependent protein kinase
VQWLHNDANRINSHPLNGSVVQRLQRFATYGSLKQQVLRIITDELAISNEQGKDALRKACCQPSPK